MSLVLCNAVILFVICPRTLSYIVNFFVSFFSFIFADTGDNINTLSCYLNRFLSLLFFSVLRWFLKHDSEATHVALVFKIILLSNGRFKVVQTLH